MVDADGATRFADLDLLETAIASNNREGMGVAIGSRAHMVNSEAVVKVRRTFFLKKKN